MKLFDIKSGQLFVQFDFFNPRNVSSLILKSRPGKYNWVSQFEEHVAFPDKHLDKKRVLL